MQKNAVALPSGSVIVVETRRWVHTLDRRHVSHTGGFTTIESLSESENEAARRTYEAIAASAHAEFFRRKSAVIARAACRVKRDGSGSITLRATLERAKFSTASAFRQLEGARIVARDEWKAAKLLVATPVILPKAA